MNQMGKWLNISHGCEFLFKPIFEPRFHQIHYFKGFHVPFELCSQIKTSRWCSRWLCCTYLGQGDQSLWLVWCRDRGVLGSEAKPRAKWNWFQSILIGVKEEEKVVLILEIGFQAMHRRKKKKKRLSELGQIGRMKDSVSKEEEEEGTTVRIRENGKEWSICIRGVFWHFTSSWRISL